MSPHSTPLALLPLPAPHTAAGKQQSKQNATKHGIFSRAILLHNESPTEYNSLLAALRDSFRPQGGIEQLLVEKLATLLWRHRRLLVSERALSQLERLQRLRPAHERDQPVPLEIKARLTR